MKYGRNIFLNMILSPVEKSSYYYYFAVVATNAVVVAVSTVFKYT